MGGLTGQVTGGGLGAVSLLFTVSNPILLPVPPIFLTPPDWQQLNAGAPDFLEDARSEISISDGSKRSMVHYRFCLRDLLRAVQYRTDVPMMSMLLPPPSTSVTCSSSFRLVKLCPENLIVLNGARPE